MTSPRTPRQWTEADIVDWPKDRPDVKDRRGTTWRWYPERDFYVTDWNEAASWMQLCKNLGPLSEVLPETPEPPREDWQPKPGERVIGKLFNHPDDDIEGEFVGHRGDFVSNLNVGAALWCAVLRAWTPTDPEGEAA